MQPFRLRCRSGFLLVGVVRGVLPALIVPDVDAVCRFIGFGQLQEPEVKTVEVQALQLDAEEIPVPLGQLARLVVQDAVVALLLLAEPLRDQHLRCRVSELLQRLPARVPGQDGEALVHDDRRHIAALPDALRHGVHRLVVLSRVPFVGPDLSDRHGPQFHARRPFLGFAGGARDGVLTNFAGLIPGAPIQMSPQHGQVTKTSASPHFGHRNVFVIFLGTIIVSLISFCGFFVRPRPRAWPWRSRVVRSRARPGLVSNSDRGPACLVRSVSVFALRPFSAGGS